MTTKRFHISDVLSVSTGRLVSTRHIEGVYDLEGHLTNDDGISTIGIAMMASTCKKFLLETFPELRAVSTSRLDELIGGINRNDREAASRVCNEWVEEVAVQLGKEYFDVPSMAGVAPRTLEDDINDIRRINPDAKIIGVVVPEEGQ